MIYYIGYYTCDTLRREERLVSPAAESKMQYISSVLSDVSPECVEIVSPAQTKAHRFVRGRRQQTEDGVFLKTFASFASKRKWIRVLGHATTRMAFLLYLLRHVKADDCMLVYHSLFYMNTIRLIRTIKKCTLILQTEELYADVSGDTHLREKELCYLRLADRYLFVTEALKKQVDVQKPSVISHGVYRALPDSGFRFDDGKIHVVYAGTFNKTKGGVYTAIRAAEHLDGRYVLEILGDGSEEEKAAVQALTEEVSAKTACEIRYVGLKTGEDFNAYIQACHIGLSTQQADGAFGGTSFPSKILMYMANGLKVVSVRIPAVTDSAVGDYVCYYDGQDACAVADAVRTAASQEECDARSVLDGLHRTFSEQFKNLLFG